MAEGKSNPLMYLRLQIAYALEFAIWGCWSYALGEFCGKYNVDRGLLYSAFALGALFSPIVGPIADKKYAAQKVFAFMQIVCGAALLYCGVIAKKVAEAGPVAGDPADPGVLWIAMMFIAGLMFMPSIPLLNAIVFKHIPDGNKSPFVFIFGTIGWIVVNLVLTHCLGGGVEVFYFLDGAIAIALAVYALTLPNTPPSGATGTGDPFGFKALTLFKRFDFALFIICATLVGIFGSNYYFAFVGDCFPGKGVYNQYSEIIFMAALAFAVAKIGLKWTLTLGMAAWGVRYLCFAQGGDNLALVGLLCHGLAYAFLYTAAYMYGERVAPKEMKASVQALIAFLLLGVAQTLSGVAASYMLKHSPPEGATSEPVAICVFETVAYAQEELPPIAEATEAVNDAVKDAAETTVDAVETATEAVETAVSDVAEGAAATADAVVEDVADGLNEAAGEVAGGTAGTPVTVDSTAKKFSVWSTQKWNEYNWKKIWGWPAIFCLIFALIFALFGKEPKAAEEQTVEGGSKE